MVLAVLGYGLLFAIGCTSCACGFDAIHAGVQLEQWHLVPAGAAAVVSGALVSAGAISGLAGVLAGVLAG